MPDALVLFMKAPRPGTVKTRLTPSVSNAEAADLYRAFIRDTLDLAKRVAGVSVYVAWTPDDGLAELKDALGNPGVKWFGQRGAHLGERLTSAFKMFVEKDRAKTIVLGGDSPLLPSVYVEEALRSLDRHDVVIGPATDGGYYLIGLGTGEQAVVHYARLFESIDWGTGRVLEQTRTAIRLCGLSCHELPPWYDVDRPADLDRVSLDIKSLRQGGDPETGRYTECALRALTRRRDRV